MTRARTLRLPSPTALRSTGRRSTRLIPTGLLTTGALALAALTGCKRDDPAPPATTEAAKPATAAPAATPAANTPAANAPPATAPAADAAQGLPPADRVFTAPLDGKTAHLLGADGDALWALRLTGPAQGDIIWRITGPGVAQKVAYGDLGDGPRLYVAWGVGRGHLDAPLVVQAIEPLTGKATELWRGQGERNEAAHLAVADVDRDGAPELDFVRYTSKYMVAPQPIERDGSTQTGEELRMASSWLRGEMDGNRGDETIIGRVYGDDRGLPGDLRIITSEATLMVPTDNGVKSLLYGTIGGEASALYFADGWVADYGKAAKAQLKRARIVDFKPEVELIGTDPDDFTFFELFAVDVDGDRMDEIVAQGGKHVMLFQLVDEQWKQREIMKIEPVLNTAVARVPPNDQATLFVPGRPQTTATVITAAPAEPAAQ